jgi:hypothetical protein
LGAGEQSVRCDVGSSFALRIAAPKPPQRADVRITHVTSGVIWQIQLTPTELKKPTVLQIEEGSYTVTIDASQFVRFTRSIAVTKKTDILLATLKPLPRLTGTLLDRSTRLPVPLAVVSTDSGCETKSDNKGHFSIDADPQKWPRAITVRAPGYADRILEMPLARADTSFDDIYLSDAASIVVDIEQQQPGGVVEVALQKLRNHGHSPGPTVKVLTVGKNNGRPSVLRFENVEPGEYVVIAKGREAWQQLGERVDVVEHADASIALQISPFTVHLRIQRGGDGIDRSRITLRNLDAFWEGIVPLELGEATIDFWQGGHFAATVQTPGSTPYIDKRTIAGGISTEWLLDLPAYEVVGTVTDSKTGAALPGAAVSLQIQATDGYSLTVSTKVAQDGSFRFAPVAPGAHTITAAAKGYPESEVTYVFADSEPSHSVALRLEPTPSTHLTVTDWRGLPVTGARVLDGRMNGSMLGFTDANGTLPVFVPTGETRDVFVVPPDGSFGFIRLSAVTPEVSLQITDGSARIVLRAETEAHEPLSGIAVVVAYNGIRLPDDLMQALSGRGSRTASDAQGRIVLEHMPLGAYEFWPVASPADLRALDSGRQPALTMGVTPGENLAVMTFSPATKA